jgi:hypothetical protein
LLDHHVEELYRDGGIRVLRVSIRQVPEKSKLPLGEVSGSVCGGDDIVRILAQVVGAYVVVVLVDGAHVEVGHVDGAHVLVVLVNGAQVVVIVDVEQVVVVVVVDGAQVLVVQVEGVMNGGCVVEHHGLRVSARMVQVVHTKSVGGGGVGCDRSCICMLNPGTLTTTRASSSLGRVAMTGRATITAAIGIPDARGLVCMVVVLVVALTASDDGVDVDVGHRSLVQPKGSDIGTFGSCSSVCPAFECWN